MLLNETIKRKQLRYVPGMISLLAVPLLFVFFTWKRLAEMPHYHTMEVNWYNKTYFDKYKFLGRGFKIPSRKFLDITLTGNIDSDKVRIAFGELYIHELYANEDSVHGIDFHFGPCSKYGEFVEVLDMLNINCVRIYAPSDNGIKVYYVPLQNDALHTLLPPAPKFL